MSPAPIATERVYLTDANGIRRLAAAPGDVIPQEVPAFGMVTPVDPQLAALVPLDGYGASPRTRSSSGCRTCRPTSSPPCRHTSARTTPAGRSSGTARRRVVVTGGRKARRKQATDRAAAAAAGDARDVAPEDATVEVPAESTSQGYDAMSVEDLQAEADKRDLAVVGTGAGGNVLKKDLAAALQANDSTLDE
jgi:pyruvate/2-oxoglutarate dehydrogenase complex dihydrolipoamide acyltransferase (E2) component